MSDFKKFYFDSNQYFGCISNESELQNIYDAYEGYLTADEILDESRIALGTSLSFGLRSEHIGTTTLRMFLRENKIEYLLNDV